MNILSDNEFHKMLTAFTEMTVNILNKDPHTDYVNTVYWMNNDRSFGLASLMDESDEETKPDAISHHDQMLEVCSGFGAELFGTEGEWPLAVVFAGEALGGITFWACTNDKRTLAASLPITKDSNARMIPGKPQVSGCSPFDRNPAACIYKTAWESQ